MLTRVRLRIIALNALIAAETDAGKNVYEYDWPTNELTMPAILVNWDRERKASNGRTQPNFTTMASLILDVRLEATDVKTARKKLDNLLWQIEQAILTSYELRKEVQQFPFVETESNVDSTSGKHVAHATVTFAMEFFEDQNQYPAIPAVPLKEIDIDVDLVNRFDPTGTYPDPDFPGSVVPAPRTQGPDGRNEGKLVIELPQE